MTGTTEHNTEHSEGLWKVVEGMSYMNLKNNKNKDNESLPIAIPHSIPSFPTQASVSQSFSFRHYPFVIFQCSLGNSAYASPLASLWLILNETLLMLCKEKDFKYLQKLTIFYN